MTSKAIRDKRRAEALEIVEKMRPHVHDIKARPDGTIVWVWPNEGDEPTMWWPGPCGWSDPGKEQGWNRGNSAAFRNAIWHLIKKKPPARPRVDPYAVIDDDDLPPLPPVLLDGHRRGMAASHLSENDALELRRFAALLQTPRVT